MIKDRLVNAECYYGLSERIKAAFEWLKNSDLEALQDGRYEIDGDIIYANVQSYETKSDALYEAHRRYIDIQYMINGAEKIGVVDYSECNLVEVYNQSKDIEFLECSSDSFQYLKRGDFLLLFPHDAHKPSLIADKKLKVKKVVVKVAI